jgi:hypothetical protein
MRSRGGAGWSSVAFWSLRPHAWPQGDAGPQPCDALRSLRTRASRFSFYRAAGIARGLIDLAKLIAASRPDIVQGWMYPLLPRASAPWRANQRRRGPSAALGRARALWKSLPWPVLSSGTCSFTPRWHHCPIDGHRVPLETLQMGRQLWQEGARIALGPKGCCAL